MGYESLACFGGCWRGATKGIDSAISVGYEPAILGELANFADTWARFLEARGLYAQHCAPCHGREGAAGLMPYAPGFALGEGPDAEFGVLLLTTEEGRPLFISASTRGPALRLGNLGGGHKLGNNVPVLGGISMSLRACKVEPHVCLDVGLVVVLLRHTLVDVQITEAVLGAGSSTSTG